ncbi:alkaline phosphatase family protein [Halococcus agarilyticus]|uniref:alkaline phosphatase family protein n=1 Tax=Halococcus agarilyticus TaxID=1232219 RepID=UPI0006781B7C|nr:alkaline phosphatase family protein [Halococcus agarilyticus]
MSNPQLLVIGLDAACFEQLDPLLSAGVMPNLAELVDSGLAADLETTHPPWTPSAWPSVVTGTTPWNHGVYDFYHHGNDEPRLVSAREIRTPFVWELLSACGLESIVVNVPVTHPAHSFRGSLVPGYIAPEGADCLIDGERQPMAALGDDYRIYARDVGSKRERIEEYGRLTDSRVAAAERLDGLHDWSFMMVQFQRTDSAFHTMGDDQRAIRQVYGRVDDAIGSLLDLAGEDCSVLVVSDHGIRQYDRVFNANTWLRDRGYAATSPESDRFAWNEETKRERKTDGETDAANGTLRRGLGEMLDGLRAVGITPQRAERLLSTVGLDEPIRRALPTGVLVDAADAVDVSRSRAYCRSVSALGLRCNVVGRDPNGVVPQDEFDELRRSLVRELSALRDHAGNAVFDDVYDRHAVHGSTVENDASAPDVVLQPTDMRWKVSDVIKENVFETTDEFSHTRHGALIAAGPTVGDSGEITPSVVDVAPTALRLLGVEPPESMDGAELPGVSVPGELESVPTVPTREYLADATRQNTETVVRDRLRDMGYVE